MLYYLPREIIHKILGNLDSRSAVALAQTSSTAYDWVMDFTGTRPGGFAAFQPVTGLQHSMATLSTSFTSSIGSASSQHADQDSLANTDTDMTSSPEEDEWEFEITPDLVRRLSCLPMRSHGNTLSTLPTELQLEVFSYLDKIDSCCLGLASPNLYVVYRAIHGTKMPLNTRRIGPNQLEAAWEVVGKKECAQCGMFRCELHQHIKDWMPKELEYCAFKQNFGLRAIESANATCYRGKPSKPKRCGRHPERTTSVHQDDTGFKDLSAPSARV